MVDTPTGSIFPSVSSTAANNAAGTNSLISTAVEEANSGASAQLVENFDTFLELLVAQIQNQDPTSPVETETFTQQLVQFSELEQSIQSNDNLETILSSIESQNAANVVNYIGATITAQGATTTLSNGQANFNLNASDFVLDAEITIRDANGNIVLETNQTLQEGNNTFTFDGVGSNGQQFNDGQAFTISASGTDANGNFVGISSQVSGVVQGVDFSQAIPALRVGSIDVPLNTVTSVNATTF